MTHIFPEDHIRKIFADPSPAATENLALRAAAVTRRYFGRAVSLYAPVYLSNYCTSHCAYCGFSRHLRIQRAKLTRAQMAAEFNRVAQTGTEQVLLLTGESYSATPLPYLLDAVRLAREYFTSVSMEVHPLSTEEYRTLQNNGVDGITLYQETYNRRRYAEVHLAGKKKDFDHRHNAAERVAQSGIRQLSMGILLGLGDPAEDTAALFQHARWMEKTYPAVEYSLSFPRLRQVKGQDVAASPVDDITFIKILCLARLCFPRASINLSTRESPGLRDRALEIAATRISAGSVTAVGGYTLLDESHQDPQFTIQDHRSLPDIIRMLKTKNFDPVLTDWRPVPIR